LAIIGFQVNAQQPGGGGRTPEERATMLTEMMKEQLSLTSAQEPKVKAINLKYANKMQDVRKMTDTAAQRKLTESLNKQKDGELKTVFTADQFKNYQKLMAEFKARRQQGKR
jgi:hypothetical protein